MPAHALSGMRRDPNTRTLYAESRIRRGLHESIHRYSTPGAFDRRGLSLIKPRRGRGPLAETPLTVASVRVYKTAYAVLVS